MEEKITEIGLFEAKTKLSELMRRVAAGESFVITVRGKRVARINPFDEISPERWAMAREAAEALRNFRLQKTEPKINLAEIKRERDERPRRL